MDVPPPGQFNWSMIWVSIGSVATCVMLGIAKSAIVFGVPAVVFVLYVGLEIAGTLAERRWLRDLEEARRKAIYERSGL